MTKYNLQTSLSASYYVLPKNLRWLFTAMMWLCAGLLMPAWIEIADSFLDWRSYLTVLSFFTCALICFTGAAPNFRGCVLESKVHTISATTAAITALLWCFIAGWQIMYVPIIAIAIVTAISVLTKTLKSCLTYWLEMMAFGATYSTVITYSILNLC
jgi:hypothetical protein